MDATLSLQGLLCGLSPQSSSPPCVFRRAPAQLRKHHSHLSAASGRFPDGPLWSTVRTRTLIEAQLHWSIFRWHPAVLRFESAEYTRCDDQRISLATCLTSGCHSTWMPRSSSSILLLLLLLLLLRLLQRLRLRLLLLLLPLLPLLRRRLLLRVRLLLLLRAFGRERDTVPGARWLGSQ